VIERMWFAIALGFVGGLSIGTLYFGALWKTVRLVTRRGRRGEGTGLPMIVSFLVRGSLATAGFAAAWYLSSPAGASALAGFLAARFIAVRHISPTEEASWS